MTDHDIDLRVKVTITDDGRVLLEKRTSGPILEFNFLGDPTKLKQLLSGPMAHLPFPKGVRDRISAVANSIASDPVNDAALSRTTARLRKAGISTDLTPSLLLLVILIWISAVVLPVVQVDLSVKDDALITNGVATIGLALAITDHIKRGK
jgi:hypothetical protein